MFLFFISFFWILSFITFSSYCIISYIYFFYFLSYFCTTEIRKYSYTYIDCYLDKIHSNTGVTKLNLILILNPSRRLSRRRAVNIPAVNLCEKHSHTAYINSPSHSSGSAVWKLQLLQQSGLRSSIFRSTPASFVAFPRPVQIEHAVPTTRRCTTMLGCSLSGKIRARYRARYYVEPRGRTEQYV